MFYHVLQLSIRSSIWTYAGTISSNSNGDGKIFFGELVGVIWGCEVTVGGIFVVISVLERLLVVVFRVGAVEVDFLVVLPLMNDFSLVLLKFTRIWKRTHPYRHFHSLDSNRCLNIYHKTRHNNRGFLKH